MDLSSAQELAESIVGGYSRYTLAKDDRAMALQVVGQVLYVPVLRRLEENWHYCSSVLGSAPAAQLGTMFLS